MRTSTSQGLVQRRRGDPRLPRVRTRVRVFSVNLRRLVCLDTRNRRTFRRWFREEGWLWLLAVAMGAAWGYTSLLTNGFGCWLG